MWFALLIIAIVVLVGFLVMTTSVIQKVDRRQLTQAATPGVMYKIWTDGNLNGVKGRYYMAAFGITRDTATKLIKAGVPADKYFTQAQIDLASMSLAVGTVVFYFRADGDQRPFKGNEVMYLAPVGDIPEVAADDNFKVIQTGTGVVITIPAIDDGSITACDKAEVCTPGILGFGGIISGTELALESTTMTGVVKIVRQVGGVKEYLTLGPTLCPYTSTNPDDVLAIKCNVFGAGGLGGPRVPKMGPGPGDLFHFTQ